MSSAIQIDHIHKQYEGLQALGDISCTVEEGEIFGFIGPDGAGKTSLFRILTTLILPDRGDAWMQDLHVVREFRKVRKIVGYMPGQFSLYGDLSVEENLTFFATVFGTSVHSRYHLIRDIYEQIEPFRDRLAGKLSGGMKQKLALSCALIHEPSILVLDEPTTGVDAISRREFWELLIGLKAKGITILVSTPYMDEAGRCDRVALIQKGSILALDRPEEIVKDFGPEIKSVRAPQLYSVLKDLRKYERTCSVFTFGQDLHYTEKGGKVDSDRLNDFLLSRGHTEVKLRTIAPGIEDVFMRLMNKDTLHPDPD